MQVRTAQQAAAMIAQIDTYDLLTAAEKKAKKEKILKALDYNNASGSQNFIKIDVDHMLALRDHIRKDPKRPKGIGSGTVLETVTEMSLFSDAAGDVKLTPQQLADRVGVTRNNMYIIIRYLRSINFLLRCEKGSVPAAKSLAENSPVYIMENIEWCVLSRRIPENQNILLFLWRYYVFYSPSDCS